MLGGLVLGTLLALGHHLFYQGLAESRVSDGTILGFSVSKQQANIAIGTAFAFLVNAFLVFAISVSFTQAFWRQIEVRYKVEEPTLAILDAAYSAFYDVFTTFNFWVWRRYPLLLLLAATAW